MSQENVELVRRVYEVGQWGREATCGLVSA